MRCEFYTYTPNLKNYSHAYMDSSKMVQNNRQLSPSFMAKPIKVDWSSDAGKLIKKVLFSVVSSIVMINKMNEIAEEDKESLETLKNNSEAKTFAEELLPEINETAAVSKNLLEEAYKQTKDPNILEKHVQIYKDAYKNRDLLKGGYSDLSDEEIDKAIIDSFAVRTLDIIGKGNLEAAFSFDILGFNNFCVDVFDMSTYLSRNNMELLKEKINPESCTKYRNLDEDIKKDKRKINQLLGKENQIKRKELLKQLEILKSNGDNNTQIKELKKHIQNLYITCENADEIRNLMNGINEKQRKMKEILNNKVNLSPQEVISKVWTIAAISKSGYYKSGEFDLNSDEGLAFYNRLKEKYKDYDENTVFDEEDEEELSEYRTINKRKINKDIKELIELIQPSTLENEKAWKKNIEKKLFERAGYKYDERVAKYFDLANCKYINELITSDDDFWQVMPALIKAMFVVDTLPVSYTIDDRLDILLHNYNTREKFDRFNMDYLKWSRYNPQSFITGTVTIRAEEVKNKTVKNLCFDLENLYKSGKIPKKERNRIFDALSELGVTVSKDKSGICIKINGKDIQYSDLASIMAVLKREFNNSSFWSKEQDDDKVENCRDMIYNHFMLQRKQEIDNAKRLKDSETVDIKVQKVNMGDVKYSLCLGNHSHCCTALGAQSNEYSAPLYILSKCISAIEVVANGEPVGNTMMYMALVNGKLSLVLDDIELQTKFQNNDKIRDMIVEYAKQVCAEVGKPNIPIYAGPGLQKVDMSNYKLVKNANMEIIGETPQNGGVYLDFDADRHDIGDVSVTTDLYRIV